jgi:hypothetical protein
VIAVRLEGGRSAFAPGDAVRGTVEWTLDATPEHLEARLLWHTEGRGTRDVGVAERVALPAHAAVGSGSFTFRAPSAPWSCSGRLVSIVWAVEVVADPAGEVAREPIVLAPGGREVQLGRAAR